MKTLCQHSERGNISELGADILQNWHHIRTQSVDMNELYEMQCYMKTKTNGRENFNKGE